MIPLFLVMNFYIRQFYFYVLERVWEKILEAHKSTPPTSSTSNTPPKSENEPVEVSAPLPVVGNVDSIEGTVTDDN